MVGRGEYQMRGGHAGQRGNSGLPHGGYGGEPDPHKVSVAEAMVYVMDGIRKVLWGILLLQLVIAGMGAYALYNWVL
ncbi:MAG: hypothetical protein JRJ45_06970 [Deltaproteobacteria bacterium]|nr:hypothetical protein [Deltaproteobacteria bacterium]